LNWEAIGAVGEILGAIAVFVSLLYLALQLRHSNKLQETSAQMARAEAIESSVKTWSTWRKMLTDAELSTIWRKAHDGESLDPDEETRLHFIVAELTYASLGAYEKYRAADAQEYEATPPAVIAREIGTSVTMRDAWDTMVNELNAYNLQDFVSEVSNHLEPVRDQNVSNQTDT